MDRGGEMKRRGNVFRDSLTTPRTEDLLECLIHRDRPVRNIQTSACSLSKPRHLRLKHGARNFEPHNEREAVECTGEREIASDPILHVIPARKAQLK